MTDLLRHRLFRLGHEARDTLQAGATRHEVLIHVAIALNGWTRTDDDHLELLAALDQIRQQIHDNTPI
ncbi:hypothetical protein [Streptomyces sp. NPDC059949]|uniref:hypothetical protein n=1 Tax=Streptomyces sp. NPDC059949 TaxID=3347013 RepID=UPI0036699D4A